MALLDIEMPGLDGIAAAAALRAGAARAAGCSSSRPSAGRATCAGRWRPARSGFVVKDAPAEQLADAIRRVHAGLRVVDPALAAETLATGESPLTGRERDVLVAARGGGTVADIARLLFLSEGTVRNYLSSAIGKTGARTRAEAVPGRRAARLALKASAHPADEPRPGLARRAAQPKGPRGEAGPSGGGAGLLSPAPHLR